MSEIINLESLLLPRVKDVDGVKKLTRQDFEDTLPEGMDMGSVKRHEAHLANYRAAGVRATNSVAFDDLVENPSKDKVETSVDYGSQSNIRNTLRRSHSIGKGEKRKDFYAHSTIVVSNGHEPELLEAIEEIAKKGKDIFGPK